MNQYRFALLKKEFIFLDRIFNYFYFKDVNDIKIKRCDNNLLRMKGSEDSYSCDDGGYNHFTRYFAVRRLNAEEWEINKLDSEGKSDDSCGNWRKWNADTVGEQLYMGQLYPNFVVEVIQNDHDANGRGEVTRFMNIYKMNRFDLAAYHQQKIDEAVSVLKAEIAAICA